MRKKHWFQKLTLEMYKIMKENQYKIDLTEEMGLGELISKIRNKLRGVKRKVESIWNLYILKKDRKASKKKNEIMKDVQNVTE